MGTLIQSIDWIAIAPPVIAAAFALIVLVVDLFVTEQRKPLLGWLTVGGLVLAGLSLLPLTEGDRTTFCLTTGSGDCSYVADHFTLIVQLLVVGGALLTALLSIHTMDELPAGEYWFLLLSSASGAALLPASRDLATLVIALEVASLPAFALVGIRRDDRLSSEAALKFFLSSVAATAVTLLGVSFLYAATGTLHLAAIAEGLTGAPLPIAAYLSVVGKAAGFAGLILVTVVALKPYGDVWGPAVAVLAALTMTVGNAAALRQRAGAARSAVRLLAWSSIGQAGYLLVPVAAAAYAGPEQIGTTIAYALMYGAVNLGAFAIAALVARTAPENRLTDYRGLYATRPLAALSLAFFLLCLAGLPPGIIGLFAKVAVFSSAVDAGLGWLAVIMAVNVVVALVYYLRWTALLFTKPAGAPAVALTLPQPSTAGATPISLRSPAPLTAAITLTAVLGIVLSGAPQLVLRFATGTLL